MDIVKESPLFVSTISPSFRSRVKEEEKRKEEKDETWDFMRDELEDFEKALQSFVTEDDNTKPQLIIVEKELTPKAKKKKPPLMPKPTLHKNGAIKKTLVSSGINGSSDSTPKPYMETDI